MLLFETWASVSSVQSQKQNKSNNNNNKTPRQNFKGVSIAKKKNSLLPVTTKLLVTTRK